MAAGAGKEAASPPLLLLLWRSRSDEMKYRDASITVP
jgi:hypothetical protein